MTGQEALEIIDRILSHNHQEKLKDIQRAVISSVWAGSSYQEIGQELGYEPVYIKQIASQLWQILSKVTGDKVSKSNIKTVLQQFQPICTNVDWGEAIDVSDFYGRTSELQTLQNWTLDRSCRLVGIFGWGGIGKTALSVKLAQSVESKFDYVVWRSLRQAPLLPDLLNEILPILVGSAVKESSAALLLKQLHEKRCLLIFDNVESILQPGNRNGLYLAGYEAYGQLYERIADENHQSCIVFTGREKPNGMSLREGVNSPIRSLQLSGLLIDAAKNILVNKGVAFHPSEYSSLIRHVDGNPLALKLLATTIQNIFCGDVQAFLEQGTTVFSDLWQLFNQQFERLSELQKQLMYWLAINREGVLPAKLKAELIPSPSLAIVLEALEALRDRSLIESTREGLTQQPVIMEYMIEKFIVQIEQEVITNKLDFFKAYTLIEAQTQDYLRDAQAQLILQPLIDRLLNNFENQGALENHLCQILDSLRHQSPKMVGYAVGNLINLFCYLKTDLQGFDFSNTAIRQAYLLNKSLYDVDFTGSHISQTTFAETFGGIIGIAFSLDGKYLATSDTKGDVQIWDSHTWEKIADCQGHKNWTWAVEFSPDSRYLASASHDYTVKLWNPSNGECLFTIRNDYSVNTVTFSPNGQLMAGSTQDGTIHLWRILPGQLNLEVQILISNCERIWSLAFSPDNLTIVGVGEDNWVRQWSVDNGHCLATWGQHDDWIRSVKFSPSGHLIATGSRDHTIKIWDAVTKKCLNTFQGHQDKVVAVAFSPDGQKLISGSYDRTIKLWDVDNGKCLKVFLGHCSRIWNVSFHPDGTQVASGGDDHVAKIWNLKLGRCINTITGHTNAVLSVAVNCDKKYLASGHEDQKIRIWDISSGKVLQILQGHANRVWAVKFAPDGYLLASGSSDYTIKLWDWQLNNCLQTLRGHDSWVWSIVFSSDGRTLVSGSYDKTIKIWDVYTGACLNTLHGHLSPVVSVAWSSNNQILASGDFGGIIKLWHTDELNPGKNLSLHTNSIWSLDFSLDGKWLVSASYDATIKIWNVVTGECVQTLVGHQGSISTAKFSPDNQFIVSAGLGGIIKVWDIVTGTCLQTIAGHSEIIYALDMADIKITNEEAVRVIAFTASLDETIKTWDILANKCLDTWKIRRPYEGMKIDNIQGLKKVQISTLQALGAVEIHNGHKK
jgi:WD40 repeat protein